MGEKVKSIVPEELMAEVVEEGLFKRNPLLDHFWKVDMWDKLKKLEAQDDEIPMFGPEYQGLCRLHLLLIEVLWCFWANRSNLSPATKKQRAIDCQLLREEWKLCWFPVKDDEGGAKEADKK